MRRDLKVIPTFQIFQSPGAWDKPEGRWRHGALKCKGHRALRRQCSVPSGEGGTPTDSAEHFLCARQTSRQDFSVFFMENHKSSGLWALGSQPDFKSCLGSCDSGVLTFLHFSFLACK